MFFSEGFLKHDFHGVFFAHLHEEPPSARESVFLCNARIPTENSGHIISLQDVSMCIHSRNRHVINKKTSYVYRYTHKVAPLAREWSGSVEARAEARAMLLWFKAAKLQLNYCFFKMVLTLPCAKLPV